MALERELDEAQRKLALLRQEKNALEVSVKELQMRLSDSEGPSFGNTRNSYGAQNNVPFQSGEHYLAVCSCAFDLRYAILD